ncbi:hypothetical protein QPK13_23145 [Photorhabdus tasmaniensis]
MTTVVSPGSHYCCHCRSGRLSGISDWPGDNGSEPGQSLLLSLPFGEAIRHLWLAV